MSHRGIGNGARSTEEKIVVISRLRVGEEVRDLLKRSKVFEWSTVNTKIRDRLRERLMEDILDCIEGNKPRLIT